MRENLYKLLYEKGGWQRYVARRFLFNFFQRLGFHVTGNHFYELVPDTRLVESKYTYSPRLSEAIDWRFSECEQEALRLMKTYGEEFDATSGKFGFTQVNNYFRGGDALILYCFLRDLKPTKMIEVGQGFSTRVALAALER